MTFEDLRQKLRTAYGGDFDHALIERAYNFAEEAHRGQKRKSGEEYMSHPIAVASRLVDWKLDAPTLAAALLHDVAEDTAYTKKDIEKKFGNEIAFLVGAVTKLKSIPYTGGAERNAPPEAERQRYSPSRSQRDGLPAGQAENIRKMVLAFAEDIRVVLIKLTDRLHNMETISFLKPDAQKRIARETLEIYAPLANRLGMGEIKGELEDLAFPIVYPEKYSQLQKMVQEPLEERNKFVKRLIPHISNLIGKEGISTRDIHARAKHWYSLWKKLEQQDMNLENIYDLVAVRVVADTIEQCYSILGAIHGQWPPLPGRIKDYIALPKPSGYRSLHTTVFGPEGKITEIQIRTREMHEEAEGGIAAHWAYSETKAKKSEAELARGLERSRNLAWVNQLREWHAHFEDPNEFMESLKIDVFKNRIFVFTPKGEVMDLPEGATPVDFAYHIHSDIGDRAAGAKINGKMSALSSELKNGDIVEILTQKNKKPSRQWLEFVKTQIARKHIQSKLRE